MSVDWTAENRIVFLVHQETCSVSHMYRPVCHGLKGVSPRLTSLPIEVLVPKRRGYERHSSARIMHKLVRPATICEMPGRQKSVASPLKACSRKRKVDSDDEAAEGSRQPIWELDCCSTEPRCACLSAGNYESSWSKLCSGLRDFGSPSSYPRYVLVNLEPAPLRETCRFLKGFDMAVSVISANV